MSTAAGQVQRAISWADVETAAKITGAEHTMAGILANALEELYPRWEWTVHVDLRNGIATVRSMLLSGKWGFVLHTRDFYSASEMRREAMRAGGELLERYKVSRRGMKPGMVDEIHTNFAGLHIHLN